MTKTAYTPDHKHCTSLRVTCDGKDVTEHARYADPVAGLVQRHKLNEEGNCYPNATRTDVEVEDLRGVVVVTCLKCEGPCALGPNESLPPSEVFGWLPGGRRRPS